MLPPRVRRVFRLALRRPDDVEADIDAEIRLHLAMRIDACMARGLSRSEAEAEALRRFGPYEESRAGILAAAREREERLTMLEKLDGLRDDLAYAVRQVRRAPALAATVAATFALGIGANATMFGVIDRLLLRPPAHVVAPEQVVRVQTSLEFRGKEVDISSYSYPAFADVRDHVPGFSGVAMHTYPKPVSLGLGSDARKVEGSLVSGSYFQTLGTRAAIGRLLLPDDDVLPDGSPVAVIGHGLWQREFGARSDALGSTITLASRPFTIVGVAPKGFVGIGNRRVDVWIPVSAAEGIRFAGADWTRDRQSTWMSVVARLRPGVAPELVSTQATAALRAGAMSEKGAKPDTRGRRVKLASVLPSRQGKLAPASRVAVLLGGVSAMVLLIACANVANLLLARALRRRREIAVRLALGISRARLVRQLVLESLLLAAGGGLAALAVVRWGSALVQQVLLRDFPWPDAPIDLRVLGYTAIATVLVGLLTGVVPALQGSAPDLTVALKDSSRGAGVQRSRTRAVLLVTQAALSVVLLVGTGLFVRSLQNVKDVELGVDMNQLLVATIDLRAVGMDSAATAAYFRDAEEAVRALPGVASAVVAEGPPFGDWSMGIGILPSGRDSMPQIDDGPYKHVVPADYFTTMGTRIVRGRAFLPSDTRGSEPVAIVNEEGARAFWPGRDALGECARINEAKAPCARIVGIAEDTHRGTIIGDEGTVQVYLPFAQHASEPRANVLLVRVDEGDPAQLVESVRRAMQGVGARVPFANVRPMRASVEQEMRPWTLGATMFGVFGAIALLLSALGLYSVVAYSVTQRTHEMGVRIALGAHSRDIRRLVLGQGLRVAAVGVAVGALIAIAAGRFVEPLLYRTSPRDPLVLATVIALLLGVATAASLVPARRATRADPLAALRAD